MGEIDAYALRAASREARQVDSRAAPDVENPPPAPAVEVDESREMMQLLEMVFVEVGKESRRAGGMLRNLQIVNVLVPIRADACQEARLGRRHDAVIYVG